MQASGSRQEAVLLLHQRYALGPLLGTGGSARVHRAEDRERGCHVAVKIATSADPTQAARFEREVELAAGLTHPNIVPIRDHGLTDDGRPWLVMDLVPGRDLAAVLATDGPLAAPRAVGLLDGCLAGVQAAHAAGIVHRDLKPANLLLTPNDDLIVLDFGGAFRAELGDTRLSRTGVLVGTPAYLPPEYIRTRVATPRSDVYQMGLVLAEMLSGRPAVDSSDVYDCLQAHCEGRLTFLDEVRAGPLWAVIRRATALEPEARFANAGQMRAALTSAPLGVVGLAPRRPWLGWAAAATAIGVAVTVGALALGEPDGNVAPPVAVESAAAAPQRPSPAPTRLSAPPRAAEAAPTAAEPPPKDEKPDSGSTATVRAQKVRAAPGAPAYTEKRAAPDTAPNALPLLREPGVADPVATGLPFLEDK